jgi:uncharacterized protein YPO0396
LLGDNGSGKTTVLDAIQVALVADLSEVLLNRAANEKSRRTLHGYVRWKIGSEDESRPGAVRFGRGACTSYALLEFRDDQDPTAAFTCGIGFEATEADTQLAKIYFVLPGATAEDVPVVTPRLDDGSSPGAGDPGRMVRPLRDFRTVLRGGTGRYWQDAGTYREELRQRLGVLPESFHRLIVKALAFKPIGQVRQFVFDYLLDPRPVDTAALQANLENYKRLEGEAKEAQDRIAELELIVREGERIRSEQRTAESHRYMELRAVQETALHDFSEQIGDPAARQSYEQRYLRERGQRTPGEIHEVFERQLRVIESRVINLVQRLVTMKTRYVERRGFAAAAEGAGYDEFALELEAWRESRLPAFQQKITNAKTKALEQLAEDIVFRLRESLLLVRRQIDELNRALQDVPFGSERYQFTVDVDPTHRDFYNLVMDAGRFEKESLFGEAALATPGLKTTLGLLLDRLVEAEAREVKTELEARADYREYFRYDLKILHADGGFSLYDKVSGDKSGGETQTPYYIAILASMYRLYRSRSLDDRPACGLVLLDEAFAKMDEARIKSLFEVCEDRCDGFRPKATRSKSLRRQ